MIARAVFPSLIVGSVFTLYYRPADFPRHWVVRCHYLLRDGSSAPALVAGLYSTFEEAAADHRCLLWTDRAAGDDQTIVGTWV